MKALKELYYGIVYRALASEHKYVPLAILGLIFFPVYYFVWLYYGQQGYESPYLRVLGFCLCLILALKDYWPEKIRLLLPFYWYLTLCYTLSFFFAFMLFKNNESNTWLMTLFSGMVLLMFLTDLISLFAIFITGIILAWISYTLTTSPIHSPIAFFRTLPTYITILIAGAIFIVRDIHLQQRIMLKLKLLASAIAHELRTPLASTRLKCSAIKDYLPTLINAYKVAAEHKLLTNVKKIRKSQTKLLEEVADTIDAEIQAAFLFIDNMIVNFREPDTLLTNKSKHSIKDCVCEALNRYPFQHGERQLVKFEKDIDDFLFCYDEILMTHVFFNLIKNALYFIAKANKGEIYIKTLIAVKNTNILSFKDTSAGIDKRALPHVFDRFYTTTQHGSGIGLAYCKLVMRDLGGDIKCKSKKGEFTEFILEFPRIG